MIFIPRVTYEQAAKEFADHGYTLLDHDVMVTKKMAYICNKHPDKQPQYIDLSHLRRGQGCKYCRAEKPSPKIVKEDKLKELCILRNLEYVKSTQEDFDSKKGHTHTVVYYICNKHRDKGVQKATLQNLKKYHGCGYCSGKYRTTEDFISQINNPNIEILEGFKGNKHHIKCRCKIHNIIWSPRASDLKRVKGCPLCSKESQSINSTLSNDEFVYRLKNKSPNITPLDIYKGKHQIMAFKCNLCGKIWKDDVFNVLARENSACSDCVRERQIKSMRKTHEQFIKELHDVNPQLEPLDKYVTNDTKIRMLCTVHNYVWEITPINTLNVVGCPKCKAYKNEKRIVKILDNWGYNYELQKCFDDCVDKRYLPFDAYLTDFNIIIEYDGEQHYWPISRGKSKNADGKRLLEYTKRHDAIKTEYCKTHGIPLIRIPYWEADNMEFFLFDEMVRCGAIEEIIAA